MLTIKVKSLELVWTQTQYRPNTFDTRVGGGGGGWEKVEGGGGEDQ